MQQRYATLAVLLALFAVPSSAQTVPAQLRMTAWAVNMTGGSSDTMEIRVNEWSAPSERRQLTNALAKGGQFGLLSALEQVPMKGRIWMPMHMSLGWNLRYASLERSPDGGRRIVIATDRHVNLWARESQSSKIDYRFSFFEIRLNADGEGEGKMAVATKLSVDRDKNLMMLEDYSAEPVRLLNIRVAKTS